MHPPVGGTVAQGRHLGTQAKADRDPRGATRGVHALQQGRRSGARGSERSLNGSLRLSGARAAPEAEVGDRPMNLCAAVHGSGKAQSSVSSASRQRASGAPPVAGSAASAACAHARSPSCRAQASRCSMGATMSATHGHDGSGRVSTPRFGPWPSW